MTKQKGLLQDAYTKLGSLIALASFDRGFSAKEIDEIIAILKFARPENEPQSTNPVAERLKNLAEMPWPTIPSEKAIRDALALGANEIYRILGVDGTVKEPQ